MGVSFSKNGIVSCSNLIESNGKNLVTNSFNSYSYTPTTENNSCLNGYQIMYDWDDDPANVDTVYRAKITVKWQNFNTNVNTNFNMYFQGTRYVIADDNWQWVGSSLTTSALNESQNLKSLVLSATSGIYTYDVTYTIHSAWKASYKGQYVGIRTDYNNGSGNITISDCCVYLDKYELNNKASIGENYILNKDIIEI